MNKFPLLMLITLFLSCKSNKNTIDSEGVNTRVNTEYKNYKEELKELSKKEDFITHLKISKFRSSI